jgi:proline iminopeptidase
MDAVRCLGVLILIAAAGCGRGPSGPSSAATPPTLAEGSYTAVLDGMTIHYEVHGHGPVLMTLPNSWGLSLEGLRAMYRPLEERLTIVCFDPRGMGGSGPVREDADMGMAAVRTDFDALRRHLGLATVDAIGWSNGAMNLILLAAERPTTIRSAIFLHGAASFTEEDNKAWAERYPELLKKWEAMNKELQDPGLTDEERTSKMKAMWLEDYFPTATAEPATTGPVIQDAFHDASFSWRHAQYAQQEAPVFDARDELSKITARCLVIAGAHDMMPPEKVRELADGLTTATFQVFNSSGHFAPLEEPEGFRESVFSFLGVRDSPSGT